MTRTFKRFGALAIAAALCAPVARAQEKISPLSDYQYKKDYAQVEGIMKETDLQKRAEQLVAFQKQHPISRMLDYVALQYLECLKPVLQAKDWAKAISLEEAFLALMPTEKSVQAANIPVGVDEFLKKQVIPSHKSYYQALMGAYYQANNLPKAAEMAEKVYALSPDKQMLVTLADIYLKLQNYDKYLSYGNKILAEFPMNQAYMTALTMAQINFQQKQNAARGMELLSKVIEAFPDKTPPGMKDETWNAQRAFYWNQMAAEAYRQKDYTKAIDQFTKASTFAPKDDTPYYYIGMSKWNSKDPEGAIPYFAKAQVLGKANAAKAKQYLEELYKARHNDSLDGLDAVLAKAKADLGIN